jgi:cytidyltransferase-like protein
MKKRIITVAVSGYFNPLHVGHLEMIERARKLGDRLVAIVNNDKQVALKGSVPFMSQKDRLAIVGALRDVDEVFLSIDKDKTVCKSLAKLKPDIFANGGDRKSLGDVPEYPVCQKLNIKMVDGLGKKIRASSVLIAEAAAKKAKLS